MAPRVVDRELARRSAEAARRPAAEPDQRSDEAGRQQRHAVAVDRADGHHPYADRRRAGSDRLEERLALGHRDLLRVVQRRERPDARPAELLVVEEDSGNDERPGERPAARLVGARDEARVELAIEPEEPLAAGSSHAAENRR